jgi:hypothetical protein
MDGKSPKRSSVADLMRRSASEMENHLILPMYARSARSR